MSRVLVGRCESAGWYLVEGATRAAGQADGLRLQMEGGSQGPAIDWPLAPTGGDGALSSIVLLPHAPGDVWLASGNGASVPQFETLGLRRVGRPQAMLRMLLGLRTERGTRDWRLMLRTIGTFATMGLLGHGVRSRDLLVTRYLRGLRTRQPLAVARAGLRHGPWRERLELLPIGQLEPVREGREVSEWQATGEDPWFRLDREGVAARLPAGWYRLRIAAASAAGRLVGPCLYPDYGQGCMQSELIPLPDPRPDGTIDTLIVLKQEVRALRFDPTLKRGRFELERFELQRLGRFSALLRMLAGVRRADGRLDWRGSAAAAWQFARTARHGLSKAASNLYARQSRDLQGRNSGYAEWIGRYDAIGTADLDAFRQRAACLASGPRISLIVPVYETPERWLRACLDSVLRQAYPHWELCIADDASPSERVREVLREYERRDPRIRVAYRDQNGHISEASNSALARATGEFVGLLDHDDELRPHSLLEMAEAIAASPQLQLLYSDEDKIDEEGRRFQPYFKPDWNPDLLLSQNYVCHFTVIRTALAREVGGFRKGFEGSQDHDLILRCSERLVPEQIHHVAKVLYHWRAIAGSTALERDAKDYASAAGARAVTEHLQRTGANATAEELAHGHYRVRWSVPTPAPKVTVIIPTRDKVELLRTCVESVLQRTRYPNYELVVVDNQSRDPEALAYLGELRLRAGIRVLPYDLPFNYSAINNWAMANSDGELLCLLNNDIEVIAEDWLDEMVGQALRPDVGAVGAMLYYPDDSIQHAGVILGVGGVANHAYVGQHRGHAGHGARAKVAQNLSAVTGACLVVRRSVYRQVGGLDESLQVAFNDIDFCLRVREAGYRNVWTPFAELYHHESASRGSDDSPEKAERFIGEVRHMEARWGGWLQRDPAYNPNLSLDELNFGLAFPPRDAAMHGPDLGQGARIAVSRALP
ncbi:MAG TPA: glycosyltransferase family 2 protein [Lysobacter sp.]